MRDEAFVWTLKGLQRQVDLNEATHYTAKGAVINPSGGVACDFIERLEQFLAGTLRDRNGVPSAYTPRFHGLWHTSDGFNFLEYRFSGLDREPFVYAEVSVDVADAWFRANAYEPPWTHASPGRVPSVEQLRAVVDAVQDYFLTIEVSAWTDWASKQEEHVFPWFARMADALRPVRPLSVVVSGWPFRVGDGLAKIILVMDKLQWAWRWFGLDVPEPSRSERREELERRFAETVAGPRYDSALSWQSGCADRDCPLEIHRLADEGRAKGFAGTLSPEEGQARFPAADQAYHSTLKYGTTFPIVPDEYRDALTHGFRILEPAVKDAEQEAAPTVSEPRQVALSDPTEDVIVKPLSARPEQPDAAPRPDHPPARKSRNPLKEPTLDAVAAYKLYVEEGHDQASVARILAQRLGRPINQGTVSKWVKQSREWRGAGNDWPGSKPKLISVDPSRLELGKRENNARRNS